MSPELPIKSADRFRRLCRICLVALPSFLALFAIFLAFMHHAFWHYGIGENTVFAQSFFDLDGEANFPAWFASAQWLMVAEASLLAFMLERALGLERQLRYWWLLIALAFLVASADEIACIHENLGITLQAIMKSRGMGTSVWTYFTDSPWLFFYILPLFAFSAITLIFIYDRFLKEHRLVIYFADGGFACYLVALIIEFLQDQPEARLEQIARFCGVNRVIFYTRSVLIEETLENLGTTAVLAAFLFYCYKLIEKMLQRCNSRFTA